MIFITGFPTILANGLWSDITVGGKNLFDLADYVSGNILMPLGALILSFYTLFIWKFKKYQDETNVGAIKLKVFNWWAPLVKLVIPAGITAIFIAGLG